MTVKRYNSLDLTKLFMAVVVIGIHTAPFKDCRNLFVSRTWEMLAGCAVPFFFLATGYLLAVKFKDAWDAPENLVIIKRYIGKTIKLYVIWSVIYLPLAIVGYINNQRSVLHNVLAYICGFFLIGEHYNSWMLWYLLSTIYALLFVLVCLKIHIPFEAVLLGGMLFLTAGIGLDGLVGWEGSMPAALQGLKYLTQHTIGSGRILQGAFYIPCGMALAKKRFPLLANCIVFPLAFTGGGITNTAITRAFLIAVCSIALFGIVEQIKLKDSVIYPIMRKMSTVLYFIHMYVWTFYYLAVYGEKTYGADSFFAVTGICTALALLYIGAGGKYRKNSTNLQKIH